MPLDNIYFVYRSTTPTPEAEPFFVETQIAFLMMSHVENIWEEFAVKAVLQQWNQWWSKRTLRDLEETERRGSVTYLFGSDTERTQREIRWPGGIGLICFVGLIVGVNVQQHRRAEQRKTKSASLNTRKSMRCRTKEDREPQMTFT